MIHFNDLYINEDNQSLIVDVEIDGFPVYEDTSINSIDLILGYCSDSPVTVNLWENKPIVVGDFDNDGKITSDDVIFLRYLCEVIQSNIYRTENGTYFYIRQGNLYETNELPNGVNSKNEDYALALNTNFVNEVVRIYNKYESMFHAIRSSSSNHTNPTTGDLVIIKDDEWE